MDFDLTNHMMVSLNVTIVLASVMCVLGPRYYKLHLTNENLFNGNLIGK